MVHRKKAQIFSAASFSLLRNDPVVKHYNRETRAQRRAWCQPKPPELGRWLYRFADLGTAMPRHVKEPIPPGHYFDQMEAAKYIGISQAAVSKAIREGRIKSTAAGIERKELVRFKRERTHPLPKSQNAHEKEIDEMKCYSCGLTPRAHHMTYRNNGEEPLLTLAGKLRPDRKSGTVKVEAMLTDWTVDKHGPLCPSCTDYKNSYPPTGRWANEFKDVYEDN